MLSSVPWKVNIMPQKSRRIDADTWLSKNLSYLVERYGGRYVVIVNGEGLVYTDADGAPRQIVQKAKAKYGGIPLFFRVPKSRDFLCALAAL